MLGDGVELKAELAVDTPISMSAASPVALPCPWAMARGRTSRRASIETYVRANVCTMKV